MKRKADFFYDWIFRSYETTPEGLAMLRIFVSLFIFFFLIPGEGTGYFAYLSRMPDDFFAPPPGPMMLFDGFPSMAVFQTIHTIMLVALAAMLAGYRTKFSSVVAGLSILILQGFVFSIGKVNHEIVIALVPAVMAFSNWGAAFSVDAFREKNRESVTKTESWPITLLALFIGFMMFTAGFPKILGGWLDLSTQATQGHLLNQFFVRERQALLAGRFAGYDNVLFWELLDWATVLLETGFIFSVFKASVFRRFVAMAVLFHFSTMMILNIAFLPNFVAYAVFLNWPAIYRANLKVYRSMTGKRGDKSKHRSVLIFSFATGCLFTALCFFGEMDGGEAHSDLMPYEIAILAGATGIVFFLFLKSLFKRFREVW